MVQKRKGTIASVFSTLFGHRSKKKISRAVRAAEREDSLRDLEAIDEFLSEVHMDVTLLRKEIADLIDLEKERKVASSGLLHINLQTQADKLDPLVSSYEAFEDDVAIQGIRLKRIIREWARLAKKAGMSDTVKEKQEKFSWLRRLK